MNSFLLHKTQDDLTSFYTYRKELKEKQRALKGTITNSVNSISVKNYEMMIGNFIEETDVTVGLFMSEQIESYPTRQAESFKLLSFLQDRTLQLLDDELTQFQSYYVQLNGRNQHMEYMGFALFSASFLSCFYFP
ncbi:hypothetical protein ACI2OX_07360 [Bacillus sp. N9]